MRGYESRMEPKDVVERRNRMGIQFGAMWTTALLVGIAAVLIVTLILWLT